jgi:hypothetical protein
MKARRIAANVAELPELLSRRQTWGARGRVRGLPSKDSLTLGGGDSIRTVGNIADVHLGNPG